MIALVAVELIVLFLLLDGDGWVRDDNLVLGLEGHVGFGWHWLTTVFFQHWGIGYNVVVAAVHKLMPIDNRWALAGMLALLGGSICVLEAIVRALFGRAWLALAVAAYFGFSILFIRPLQWWAGGLQYFPTTFCDLLCLYAYVRFLRERSRRWVGLGAGALAAGLSFYEKPAYMLLYLLLLRVLLLSRELSPRAIARAIWRERSFWGALLAVIAVWAVGYVLVGAGKGFVAGHVTVGEYLSYFRVLWVTALVPAVFGVTLPGRGLDAAQVALAAVLQLAVVVVIAISVARNRSAWRAWLFLAIMVLANGLLVAHARLAQWGPTLIGNDLRYLPDFAWLVPLAVCFAFSPPAALPSPAAKHRALTLPPRLRPAAAAVVVALLGYAGVAIATTVKLQREWSGRQARAWESRLRAGLARFRVRGTRPVIADSTVPWFIIDPRFVPANRLSWMTSLYDPGAQVGGVLDGPLVTVDQTGFVHRATIAGSIDSGNPSQLLRRRQLSITDARSVLTRGTSTCVTAGASQTSLTRRLPSVAPTTSTPYYLWLSYTAQRSVTLPMFVDSGTGGWAGPYYLLVARGRNASILFLDHPPHRLLLRIDPEDALCITRFEIVTLRPGV